MNLIETKGFLLDNVIFPNESKNDQVKKMKIILQKYSLISFNNLEWLKTTPTTRIPCYILESLEKSILNESGYPKSC